MANVWTSPSLDTLSSESSPSIFFVGWHILLTLPGRLWAAYVAYLWCYQPNSWVGRVASAFRILAVALILPVVLLTLLDVTSYVIARTLGVVDDVKAATSDADTGAVGVPTPTIVLPENPARASEGRMTEDPAGRTSGDGRERQRFDDTVPLPAHAPDQTGMQPRTGVDMGEKQTRASDASLQACYFAGESRLAGEGVFSPAVSGPPSPLAPRMQLHAFAEDDGRGSGQVSEEEGIVLRRRARDARSGD